MKIPEKVKIGGYIISIHFKNMDDEHKENMGEYHHFTQEIWLDERMTVQQCQEVFVHELLEAIKDIYLLDYPHEILNINGVVLHSIIKDNPEIFNT